MDLQGPYLTSLPSYRLDPPNALFSFASTSVYAYVFHFEGQLLELTRTPIVQSHPQP